MEGRRKGLYLGTEVVGKRWFKRYLKDRLFARGNGLYWFGEDGFYFLRYLTRRPIFIRFSDILEITLGTKHAGRWAMGNLIVKIIWRKDGLILSSGFLVSKKKENAITLKADLEEKIHVI
jgi:hypothetical protein